jgi:hypothetical protein
MPNFYYQKKLTSHKYLKTTLHFAAELLATSKAIVMMDGNLSTLNMDVHPAKSVQQQC